jgi:AraC-like DNA-binding protein
VTPTVATASLRGLEESVTGKRWPRKPPPCDAIVVSAPREIHVQPRSELLPWVSEIRVAKSPPGRTYHLAQLPCIEPSILFRATADGTGDLSLVGPRTRARYKSVPAVPFYVSVRLRPGRASRLLGLGLDEMADAVAPLGSVWGTVGSRLRSRLLGESATEVIRSLQIALLERVAHCADDRRPTREVMNAVQVLRRGQVGDVADAARAVGVSLRQLRRIFREHIGMSPKRCARIQRLHRALEAQTSGHSWAERASEAGFYDQAHLIADFRDLLDATPTGLRDRVHDAPSCAPGRR